MRGTLTPTVFGALLIILPAMAEQNREVYGESARRHLEEKISPAKRRAAGAVEEVVLGELRFVSEVSSDDVGGYYDALMDTLETCATDRTIPVLERLLNRMPSHPQEPFRRLQSRAARLWYERKTEGLTLAQKVGYALYGFQKEPPVRIPMELAREMLVELGAPARPQVYDLLERSTRGPPRWALFAGANLMRVLREKPFLPRDEELRRFLKRPGTLGCLAMAELLAERRDDRAVAALLSLVRSDNPDVKFSAAENLKHFRGKVAEIAPVLISEASKDRIVPGKRTAEAEHVRWRLMATLARLGKDERTVSFFREYLQEMWSEGGIWELPEHGGLREHVLTHCIEVARKTLRAWGAEPRAEIHDNAARSTPSRAVEPFPTSRTATAVNERLAASQPPQTAVQ